ncbi:hypothetical protein BV321_05288 [Pseudomonas syringae pv. actinidiae]|nr:hypothetical protein BV321_05288 [Pseudomonas syringae pv. actinidiae]OSR31726.1 hypothetical protein BV322_05284 [Pseudomonas syringae pv. actinidiae]
MGANLFAKRAVQSMHFCVWNTAFANKFAPTGIHELLWERTCSRRGRCSRCISASGIQPSRTSSLLQASTSFCGSELVREEGGAVDAFLRLEYSLREQVRSYRHPRAFVGANLFAKRAVQSMHFCVWNNAFANKFAPTGIHELLRERTCSRRGRCSRCIFCVWNNA